MNPQQTVMIDPITPRTSGYLIESDSPAIAAAFFTDARLITARRAAMNHLETLLTALWQQEDFTVNIQIHLVEADPENPQPTAQRVALIYQRRAIDCGPWSPQQFAVCQQELDSLNEEFNYYLAHLQALGQGYYHIDTFLEVGNDQPVPVHQLIVLADAFSYAFVLVAGLGANTPQADNYFTTNAFYSMRLLTVTPQTN
jgi:hypothetical protein